MEAIRQGRSRGIRALPPCRPFPARPGPPPARRCPTWPGVPTAAPWAGGAAPMRGSVSILPAPDPAPAGPCGAPPWHGSRVLWGRPSSTRRTEPGEALAGHPGGVAAWGSPASAVNRGFPLGALSPYPGREHDAHAHGQGAAVRNHGTRLPPAEDRGLVLGPPPPRISRWRPCAWRAPAASFPRPPDPPRAPRLPAHRARIPTRTGRVGFVRDDLARRLLGQRHLEGRTQPRPAMANPGRGASGRIRVDQERAATPQPVTRARATWGRAASGPNGHGGARGARGSPQRHARIRSAGSWTRRTGHLPDPVGRGFEATVGPASPGHVRVPSY